MKKILLIDDENSIARLVGSMAGDAGYAFAYAGRRPTSSSWT